MAQSVEGMRTVQKVTKPYRCPPPRGLTSAIDSGGDPRRKEGIHSEGDQWSPPWRRTNPGGVLFEGVVSFSWYNIYQLSRLRMIKIIDEILEIHRWRSARQRRYYRREFVHLRSLVGEACRAISLPCHGVTGQRGGGSEGTGARCSSSTRILLSYRMLPPPPSLFLVEYVGYKTEKFTLPVLPLTVLVRVTVLVW
jgi:hypothetical protein